MTKEALNKLNEKQLHYCKVLSCLISRGKSKGISTDNELGKLRGYLECLADMGVITAYEMGSLYLWFFSENRSEDQP